MKDTSRTVVEKTENKRLAPRCALVAIIAYAFLFYFLTNASCIAGTVNDDFHISELLSNRCAETSPSLFVNAAFSYVIIALNSAIPNINWYFALTTLATLSAFCLLSYYAITRLSLPLALVTCANVFFLMIEGCTYDPNFTVFAGICSLSGLFVLALSYAGHRVGKLGLASAVLLCIVSFCLRFESFLLTFAFFAITITMLTLFSRSKTQSSSSILLRGTWRDLALKLIPVFLLLGIAGSLYLFNQYTWNAEPNAFWKESNHARSQLSDYPCKEYDEIAEELDAIGISENDYAMLRSWQTADSTVFSAQTMSKVVEIAQTDPDMTSLFSRTVQRVKAWIASAPIHTAGIVFVLLIESLFIISTRVKKARVLLVIMVVFACLISVYFMGLGRFPERVQNPIWAAAFTFPIILAEKKLIADPNRRVTLLEPILSVAFSGIMLVYCIFPLMGTFDSNELYEKIHQDQIRPQSELLDYVRNGSETVVTDGETSVDIERIYKFRNIPDSAYFEKLTFVGGWRTNSPAYFAQLQTIGQTDVFPSLLADDVLFCQRVGSTSGQNALIFLREHYDPGATCTVVTVIEDSTVGTEFEVIKFVPSNAALNNAS